MAKKASRWATLKAGIGGEEPRDSSLSGAGSPGMGRKWGSLKKRFSNDAALKNSWMEMKFRNETPSCRTLHAEAVLNEKLIIYGGTDIKNHDASTNFLWVLEPLLREPPQWIKIPINDKEHVLPDGLKRH